MSQKRKADETTDSRPIQKDVAPGVSRTQIQSAAVSTESQLENRSEPMQQTFTERANPPNTHSLTAKSTQQIQYVAQLPPQLAQNSVGKVSGIVGANGMSSPGLASNHIPYILTSSKHMRLIPPNDEVIRNLAIPDSPRKLANILTYRRSHFDFEVHQAWINNILVSFLGFETMDIKPLLCWVQLLEGQQYALRPVPPPAKLDIPKIHLGHLFSTDVFGNDLDAPLYYFNIVQGLSDSAKVVITSSRAEAAGAAYYEAVCGYSTVFIFAICQTTRLRCMTIRPSLSSIRLQEVRDVRDALASVTSDPMTISIIY
jgi:hypothetical protein